MHVAVVGAGIVGAAVARELALRGVSVTVFDQSRPGTGTSGTTFAWVNSHNKAPDSYHRLNVKGCEEHRRLAGQPTTAPDWYSPTGNVEWAVGDDDRRRLDERMARLQAAEYPCRWIDPDEARRMEPDLLLGPEVEKLAYFPDEAHVQPTLLLARLLGEARDHGAALRRLRVAHLESVAAGVEVVGDGGERERFDRVVSCVGRWSQQLAEASGVSLPLVDPTEVGGAAVGYLAYTAPAAVRLSRLLTSPHVHIRPDGGGRLVLQGLDLDGTADPAAVPGPDSEIAAELRRRLPEVLAMDEPPAVVDLRVGQRVLPADGRTVAGHVGERRYFVATHSGVTLGPLLGRLVASELLGGDESELLGDFRPDRFVGAEVIEAVRAPRLPGEQ